MLCLRLAGSTLTFKLRMHTTSNYSRAASSAIGGNKSNMWHYSRSYHRPAVKTDGFLFVVQRRPPVSSFIAWHQIRAVSALPNSSYLTGSYLGASNSPFFVLSCLLPFFSAFKVRPFISTDASRFSSPISPLTKSSIHPELRQVQFLPHVSGCFGKGVLVGDIGRVYTAATTKKT